MKLLKIIVIVVLVLLCGTFMIVGHRFSQRLQTPDPILADLLHRVEIGKSRNTALRAYEDARYHSVCTDPVITNTTKVADLFFYLYLPEKERPKGYIINVTSDLQGDDHVITHLGTLDPEWLEYELYDDEACEPPSSEGFR